MMCITGGVCGMCCVWQVICLATLNDTPYEIQSAIHHMPFQVTLTICISSSPHQMPHLMTHTQGHALWVGKVGSAYLKQNNQVPHFSSGVQLGTWSSKIINVIPSIMN